MKKRKVKKHTGKAHHADMGMFHASRGQGGKDPHAHATHHASNKSFGMPEGMSPVGGYDDEAAEMNGGMSENCCEDEE